MGHLVCLQTYWLSIAVVSINYVFKCLKKYPKSPSKRKSPNSNFSILRNFLLVYHAGPQKNFRMSELHKIL